MGFIVCRGNGGRAKLQTCLSGFARSDSGMAPRETHPGTYSERAAPSIQPLKSDAKARGRTIQVRQVPNGS